MVLAKLFAEERRKRIFELLQADQRVSVKRLSEVLDVSEATLRTDLKLMEDEGLLTRTHGGAVIADEIKPEYSFTEREKRNRDLKVNIARKAAELVHDGDCILIDASSTTLELARLLRQRQIRLTVVTNGISAAMELKENPGITVILLGGVLRMGSVAVEGQLGTDILEKINTSKLFASASGFTLEDGLTDFNVYEVELKKAMVQSVSTVIAMLDHSKFGKSSLSIFCETGDIDMLIADSNAPKETLEELERKQVQVLVV